MGLANRHYARCLRAPWRACRGIVGCVVACQRGFSVMFGEKMACRAAAFARQNVWGTERNV